MFHDFVEFAAAGISEREQQGARGGFTAPGRDESFATETRE